MTGESFSQNGEIVGILKRLKDETSTDLSALENHQDLVKAEVQPRPARPPLWREKLQHRDECILVQRHEAASQEGVMNFHLCSSIPINSLWEALEMKAQ